MYIICIYIPQCGHYRALWFFEQKLKKYLTILNNNHIHSRDILDLQDGTYILFNVYCPIKGNGGGGNPTRI